jgi:hypothetical protein
LLAIVSFEKSGVRCSMPVDGARDRAGEADALRPRWIFFQNFSIISKASAFSRNGR